ncbi:MAG: glycosyltransferase [Ginsengibacter sp.]
MRVLWFTNSPSLSSDFLDNEKVGSSWIGALEGELTKLKDIELGIAFNLFNSRKTSFTINQTKYFPVSKIDPLNRITKITQRWAKKIQGKKDLQPYLDIIDDFQPDVIHIFGTEEVYGLIASETHIPCIIHIQGNLNVSKKKWYSGISKWDILKYSNKWSFLKGFGIIHDYLTLKKAAEREELIFNGCKYFMGRTDWDRRITSILAPHSSYFHCEEVLRSEFYSKKWAPHLKRKKYVIISTIRNNIYKGLETVYESMQLLNKYHPQEKVIWKIVGTDETDEIAHILEKKYKSTFREHDIELLGSLNETDLIREMLDSDLFVHPSHIDNSPNSVCEAMMLGMPIITTFSGGTPSIIENKTEGLLVQDGDPYAMVGAIIELKNDTNYAADLGLKGRSRAVERHNPHKIIDGLIEIYSSVTTKTKKYKVDSIGIGKDQNY